MGDSSVRIDSALHPFRFVAVHAEESWQNNARFGSLVSLSHVMSYVPTLNSVFTSLVGKIAILETSTLLSTAEFPNPSFKHRSRRVFSIPLPHKYYSGSLMAALSDLFYQGTWTPGTRLGPHTTEYRNSQLVFG